MLRDPVWKLGAGITLLRSLWSYDELRQLVVGCRGRRNSRGYRVAFNGRQEERRAPKDE